MDKLLQAYDLMILSVIKPDDELRSEAKEEGCYQHLLLIRSSMLDYLVDARTEHLTYLLRKP